MTILVVDDSDEAREIMDATLASGGYESVDFAASAEEALQMLGVEPRRDVAKGPDVILLDIVMPGVDGVEACARIRADERHRDTPILMVTSLSDMNSLSHAFMAGANDYVTKPFQRIELLARLRSALKLKGEFDRRRAREIELAGLVRRPESGTHPLDQVAGLPDRRIVETQLRWAVDSCFETTWSVLAVQVDDLEAYRMRYGAARTVAMLGRVAHAVGSVEAPLDSALSGGANGEFLLTLRRCGAERTRLLKEELEEAVAALAIPHCESRKAEMVTVSIGMAGPFATHDPRPLLGDALLAARKEREAR